MSFYSRIAILMSENKLARKDFPIKIQYHHTQRLILTPEELLLISINQPDFRVIKTGLKVATV